MKTNTPVTIMPTIAKLQTPIIILKRVYGMSNIKVYNYHTGLFSFFFHKKNERLLCAYEFIVQAKYNTVT